MKDTTITIKGKPFTYQDERGDKYQFEPMTPKDGERILTHTAKLLDECQIPYILAFGTLLGAVREGYFIKGDDDVDIIVTDEQRLYDNLPYLYEHGLFVNRIYYETLYSFHTEGRLGHIDMYIMREFHHALWKPWCYCIFDHAMPKKYFKSIQKGDYTLGGVCYPYPENPEALLEWWYGKTWRIPSHDKGKDAILLQRMWRYPRRLFEKIKRHLHR